MGGGRVRTNINWNTDVNAVPLVPLDTASNGHLFLPTMALASAVAKVRKKLNNARQAQASGLKVQSGN